MAELLKKFTLLNQNKSLIKKTAVQLRTTVIHPHGPGYSLKSCSPAVLFSALPGILKINNIINMVYINLSTMKL